MKVTEDISLKLVKNIEKIYFYKKRLSSKHKRDDEVCFNLNALPF